MRIKGVKKVAALLAVLMLVLVIAGCSSSKGQPVSSQQSSTFTVTDQAGRQVEIPAQVNSVAMTWGPAANFVLALGKGNIVTGINYTSDFAAKVAPNLAGVGSVGKGKPDMEALAKVKPDVFIHKANDIQTLDAVQKLGIPAVGIYSEGPEDMIIATQLVGKVLGAEDKAAQLINYYNEKNDFIKNLVKDIPASERKTAIVMGSDIGQVANGTMIQSYLIETAGGINQAKAIESKETWPMVGTEQIFAWNPDYIFCATSNQGTYKIDELKKDASFAKLAAVKNNRIALIPSTQDLWDFPGVQSVLGSLWMLNQMYPEKYSEADLVKDVEAFYNMAYGMNFERQWLGY